MFLPSFYVTSFCKIRALLSTKRAKKVVKRVLSFCQTRTDFMHRTSHGGVKSEPFCHTEIQCSNFCSWKFRVGRKPFLWSADHFARLTMKCKELSSWQKVIKYLWVLVLFHCCQSKTPELKTCSMAECIAHLALFGRIWTYFRQVCWDQFPNHLPWLCLFGVFFPEISSQNLLDFSRSNWKWVSRFKRTVSDRKIYAFNVRAKKTALAMFVPLNISNWHLMTRNKMEWPRNQTTLIQVFVLHFLWCRWFWKSKCYA